MRLLTTFGLVIAFFFISTANASIYDVASKVAPKIENSDSFNCESLYASSITVSDASECIPYYKSKRQVDGFIYQSCSSKIPANPYDRVSIACTVIQSADNSSHSWLVGKTTKLEPTFSASCPPDGNTTHLFDYDSNSDGKTDYCYDPNELTDLSDCSLAPDFLANSSGQTGDICITQSTGTQCGYVAGSNGGMTQSSSVQCYDPFTPVDEFGNDELPNVELNQCVAFGSGYACSADPLEICSGGVCPDNCGSVNDQFVCFNDSPNLPEPTDPTDPINDLDPTIDDPSNPDDVLPSDPSNALSNDLSIANNRLGDLIQLTRDKGNDTIYAINKKSNDVIATLSDSNNTLDSIKQTLSSSDDLVAAVDITTGEILSVMRESQVKLADLGDNVLLTKDIQQNVLEVSQETNDVLETGFDNIINFMKSVDEPDSETGESKMDVLIATNSDGFAELQNLMNDLLDSPGILSSGGSASDGDTEGETTEPAPNPDDFVFDLALEQARFAAALDTTDIDNEIILARQNLVDTFNDIKSTFNDTFSVNIASGGSLPSLGVIGYRDSQTDVSLEPYSEQMSMIGLALLFITTVSCLIIVFR